MGKMRLVRFVSNDDDNLSSKAIMALELQHLSWNQDVWGDAHDAADMQVNRQS